MARKVRITESELIKLIQKVISEQSAGPDAEILAALEDMGFAKNNCRNYENKSEKLAWEYCHSQRPYVIVSYPSPYDALEILDTKNLKKIATIENPTAEDLEGAMKGYFASN